MFVVAALITLLWNSFQYFISYTSGDSNIRIIVTSLYMKWTKQPIDKTYTFLWFLAFCWQVVEYVDTMWMSGFSANVVGVLFLIWVLRFHSVTKFFFRLWPSSSMNGSVRPSVCLSVRHTFFTMFPSSHHEIFRCYYQWKKWCPYKRSKSEVKGQGHRGQSPT